MDELNTLIDRMHNRLGKAGMILVGLKSGNAPDVYAFSLLRQIRENLDAEKAARAKMEVGELDSKSLAVFKLLGAYIELLDSLVTQSEEIVWKTK